MRDLTELLAFVDVSANDMFVCMEIYIAGTKSLLKRYSSISCFLQAKSHQI